MRTPKIVLLVPAQRGGGDRRDDGVRRGSDDEPGPPHRHLRQLHGRDAGLSRSRRAGWEVWETVGNTGKKGGALNQAWDRLDGYLADDDYLVTMDADTLLDEHFVENAYAKYQQKRRQGHSSAGSARTSRCRARQRARRPAEDGVRARGEDQSLQARDRAGSAAATMFSVRGLREVHDSRGRLYEPVLTEDYELSLALRVRGYETMAPRNCLAHTDLMPTVKMLWAQRLRWYRGAPSSRCATTALQARPQRHRLADLLAWAAASRWLFLVALAVVLLQAGHMTFSPLLLPLFASPPSSGWCR